MGGSYDYCEYNGWPGATNKAFEAKSYKDKNDYFWSKITADTHINPTYPNVAGVVSESIQDSFMAGDEMPNGAHSPSISNPIV